MVDDEDRENEGDLIFAAELATPELMGFTVRHSSGVICVAITGEACDRLDLPPMYHLNQDRKSTAFTVSVDAKEGVTTGISAAERAHTVRLLADPKATDEDLSRPGHVFPLRAREGGVLVRPGHTEAAVDLTALAGLPPAGALCEIVKHDGIDGPAARAAGVRPPAPARADLHRRPDRLPADRGGADPPGRRPPGCRCRRACSTRSATSAR